MLNRSKIEKIIRLAIFVLVNVIILWIIGGLIYTLKFGEQPLIILESSVPIEVDFINYALVLSLVITIVINILVYMIHLKGLSIFGKIMTYIFFLMPVFYLVYSLIIPKEVSAPLIHIRYYISYFKLYKVLFIWEMGVADLIFVILFYTHSLGIAFNFSKLFNKKSK